METKKNKIGYSEDGGIFISKDIDSDYHKHNLISVIISFGSSFKVTIKGENEKEYKAALIQNNINYCLKSQGNEYIAFFHINPYSEIGLKLMNRDLKLEILDPGKLGQILKEIKIWFGSSENEEENTKKLINTITSVIYENHNHTFRIDDRINRSLHLIKENSADKLLIQQIASSVNLSSSHYARLFKKEIGISFRKYVLHQKLIKSLYAMFKQNNLTEASYFGGFSDQPHFTKTFKNAFGIKPSLSTK